MQSLLQYFGILSAATVEKDKDEASVTAESSELELSEEMFCDIGFLLSMINLNIWVKDRSK
ncbi:hypothetical protein D3C76_93790 [compost metagenome]